MPNMDGTGPRGRMGMASGGLGQEGRGRCHGWGGGGWGLGKGRFRAGGGRCRGAGWGRRWRDARADITATNEQTTNTTVDADTNAS